jgi:putative copper resistance protein D
VYSVTIMLTHLTGFMNEMMLNPWLASAEDLLYLTAGLLFFLPLLGSEPIGRRIDPPQRIFLLFLAMPVDTFTGLVLGQTNHYPWPAMAAMRQPWAPSLLADLHGGGAVMWIGGDAIMGLVMGGCFLVWARGGAQATAGGWLEGARLRTLQTNAGSVASDALTADTDAHLAAYNDYLGTLSRLDAQTPDRPPSG